MGRIQIVAYPYLAVPFFVPKLDQSSRRRKNMPYELLYTRSISSDDRVRFTDVPITSASIMVDVLSLRSPYYRIAGYAYSIVSDGLIDYERGSGYTLPFGKNRLLFPNAVLPYYLEFFPKWGTKQAIISVYVGDPSSQPPIHEWKQAPTGPYQMKLNTSPLGASYRSSPSDESVVSMMNGAMEAVMTGEFVYWKNTNAIVQLTQIGLFTWSYIVSDAEYQSAKSNGENIIL